MSTIELKSNLHKIVGRIEDERLLRAIYSFLEKRESAEDGRMWKQLTDEQKKEVLHPSRLRHKKLLVNEPLISSKHLIFVASHFKLRRQNMTQTTLLLLSGQTSILKDE